MRKVLLGYEIGTGAAIEVPILHTAVTGQTQQSGKTTTLEALITRSGLRAVTFVTKRAEGAFESQRRIPAYFRERADWQFVSALLEATMRERMKFERSWIMRVCKGASTLKAVHENVKAELRDATGLNESVYLTLDEYLQVVIPQIERLPYSTKLELEPGINAIDVADYSSEVQALVIRSVIEWVYDRERDTIVLIPEAWEFIPQKRNSPVKLAAVELIRKGAAAGNFVWLDSQDIAGVDKEVLKQISVWILGVQREVNEVKRTLAHLPPTAEQPTVKEIMTLGRGEFYVSHGSEMHAVYVQPAWLSAEKARRYAMEELPPSFVAKPKTKKKKIEKETAMPARKSQNVTADGMPRDARNVMERCEHVDRVGNRCKFVEKHGGAHVLSICAYERGSDDESLLIAQEENAAISRELYELFNSEYVASDGSMKCSTAELTIRLLRELKERRSGPRVSDPRCTAPEIDMEALADNLNLDAIADRILDKNVDDIVEKVMQRLQSKPEFTALQVSTEKPELNVTVQRKVIEVDGSTLRGRLAQLIAQGWFDEGKTGNTAYNELQRLGFGTAKPNVYRELDKLAEWGFVTKEPSGGYQAVAGMKVNVREVQVA